MATSQDPGPAHYYDPGHSPPCGCGPSRVLVLALALAQNVVLPRAQGSFTRYPTPSSSSSFSITHHPCICPYHQASKTFIHTGPVWSATTPLSACKEPNSFFVDNTSSHSPISRIDGPPASPFQLSFLPPSRQEHGSDSSITKSTDLQQVQTRSIVNSTRVNPFRCRVQCPKSHPVSSANLPSQRSQQQQQQQQLPPFSEILAAHTPSVTESTAPSDSLSTFQPGTMTRATFQQSHVPSREPPSPEQSLTGNSVDTFDNMSARSGDSTYAQRHYQPRQPSSWTPTSQYTDSAGPYSTQQRGVQFPQQGPFPSSRASPSLPSIRDIDRFNNYESPFPQPASSYPQPYPTSTASPTGQEGFSFPADRSSYYDHPQRYAQHYPQPTRPNASQVDYPRYQPSPYDYRAGVPYQPGYAPVDYTASPTSMHHSSSPTVAIDADNRNRKRRGNLPKQVTDILRAWFIAHLDHPYPTEDDKQAFVNRTGLTIAQISNWFINARRRHWPALRHAAAARERGSQGSTAEFDSDSVRRQQSESTMR